MTTQSEHWQNYRAHFRFRRPAWVNLVVSAVAAAVTLAARQTPSLYLVDRYVDWGAKSNSAMAESAEWWRLITANFLHMDNWHLLFNAVLLCAFGGMLENVYRRIDVMWLMLASGVMTCFTSFLLSDAVSLGASGMAIACTFACVAFGIQHKKWLPPSKWNLFVWLAGAVGTVYLFAGARQNGVDNSGHFAGAMSGVLFGIWVRPEAQKPPRARGTAAASLALVSLIALASAAGWSTLHFKLVFPSDRLAVRIPDSFTVLARGPHYQVFENGIGTSLLVEENDEQSAADAATKFETQVLPAIVSADDIRDAKTSERSPHLFGGTDAQVLTMRFTSARGAQASWHAWFEHQGRILHVVWTCRAHRAEQNADVFWRWLRVVVTDDPLRQPLTYQKGMAPTWQLVTSS